MRKPPKLIGICGKAGSGKDTLAQGLAAIDVYMIYSFAAPIKAALNAMFGWGMAHWELRDWKEEQIPWLTERYSDMEISPRTLAQTLGTEWGRETIHPEIWLRLAQRKFEKIKDTGQLVSGRIIGGGMIIPDVRYTNEAEWIKRAGGVMLEVVRQDSEDIQAIGHISEQGVPVELIDFTILNDGPPSKMVSDARRLIWRES